MDSNKKLTYQGKPRTYGFRFSLIDALFLIIAAIANTLLWSKIGELSLFIAFVVVHFFLFCNIFRIYRNSEFFWAATFVIHCSIWAACGNINVLAIFAIQFVLTIVLIAREMRSKNYHGIFARQINKNLNEYLGGHF